MEIVKLNVKYIKPSDILTLKIAFVQKMALISVALTQTMLFGSLMDHI